jgi:hypothetical protein
MGEDVDVSKRTKSVGEGRVPDGTELVEVPLHPATKGKQKANNQIYFIGD